MCVAKTARAARFFSSGNSKTARVARSSLQNNLLRLVQRHDDLFFLSFSLQRLLPATNCNVGWSVVPKMVANPRQGRDCIPSSAARAILFLETRKRREPRTSPRPTTHWERGRIQGRRCSWRKKERGSSLVLSIPSTLPRKRVCCERSFLPRRQRLTTTLLCTSDLWSGGPWKLAT